MNLIECITGGYSSSAKVVGNTLILSLPDARSPVVWRMELGEIKAASFEIKQEGDNWTLVMKVPKGEAQNIAPFENKTRAVHALMAASRAMEQATVAKSAANDAGAPVAQPRKGNKGQIFAGIIGVAVVGFIIFAITQGPQSMQHGAPTAASTAQTAEEPANKAGVPVSADSFLMNR